MEGYERGTGWEELEGIPAEGFLGEVIGDTKEEHKLVSLMVTGSVVTKDRVFSPPLPLTTLRLDLPLIFMFPWWNDPSE